MAWDIEETKHPNSLKHLGMLNKESSVGEKLCHIHYVLIRN